MTKKIILSLIAFLFTIHNISAKEISNTIVVPPDPEDLVNGYALIVEISLYDYLLNLDMLEVDSLSKLPLEDLKTKTAITIPELPDIDLSEFVSKKDLLIQNKIELTGKLKQLHELQEAIEQIYYAEYLSVNTNDYVLEAIKNREHQYYYNLLKIRADLKRIIYSASMSSRDMIDGIHYKTPMDYPVEVPKSIRIQLKDKRVRYSELKRLNRTIGEIGSSFNWSPLKDQKLKSDVLIKEVEKLQEIKNSLLMQFLNVSQPLPETIQKEAKDYKIFSGIQETLGNLDGGMNFPEIEAELSELKGTQYYQVALNSITEVILNSNNPEEAVNLEKNLQNVVGKFPSLFETQRSLLLLGKIELVKTRPDLNMAINLLAKAADFPSTKYLDEAVYEYAKASFMSDDDLKIRSATEKLILLIRGYAYDEPNADHLQKTAVLYLKNLIEKNGSRFAQNKDEIHNTLFVPENQNFNEAIEVIYLETLSLTYPDNPDVSEIIKRFEVASGINPKLELLKIEARENLSGDIIEGYARRVLLLEKINQLDGMNPYLNLQSFKEVLQFQIFEMAAYLSRENASYYENAMRQADNYLTCFPDSPNAFTVANNRSELAYLTSDNKGKLLESFRLSLETINYTNDPGQQIGIADRIISRLLKNGYDIEDISDENLYKILSGKVKYPAGNEQPLAILTKSLLIYKDVSETLNRDQKLIPVIASDFADKGFYKSASFLYHQYIQKNPEGSFVEESLDGFFIVNMKQENYDELNGLVDFISHSDDYSPDLKNKVLQYHNELDILLAKQMSLNGDKKESEKILEQALAENPDISTGASALFELAIRAEEEGRLQDAIDYFLTLTDIYPESNLQPEALQNFAYLLERKKKNDAGFSPITSDDIGFAFLKAARADIPNDNKNSLYLKAVLYLKYGDDCDATLEALKGFYDTNKDPSRTNFAIGLYSSLLWQKQDLYELIKIFDSPGRQENESTLSLSRFYSFMVEVRRENFKGVKSQLDQMENGSLKNTMNAVLLDVENRELFERLKKLNSMEYKKAKEKFESIMKQYDPLFEDNTLSAVIYEIKLADYQKELVDNLKRQKKPGSASSLQPPDTADRLNEVINSYEIILHMLTKAGNKLEMLEAVFDTMVTETGRTKDFYWDFLGIYSAEILSQYPYYSEQQLFQDLKKEIEEKKDAIINETLDVLQDLIRYFLSVRSPRRDETSVIYYDYSVLNDLVLPRFVVTTELIKSLETRGIKPSEQLSSFVVLYGDILKRNRNILDRLLLNQYEPAVSSLAEKISHSRSLSRDEIDRTLDFQELMADLAINGTTFSKLMTLYSASDELLEKTRIMDTENYLNDILELVRKLSRIRGTIQNLIPGLENENIYLAEDLLTGSRESEKRILTDLWNCLENCRDISHEIRQNCLMELVTREPSQYIHHLGMEGKKLSLCSSRDFFNQNRSKSENSSWEIGPFVGQIKGGDNNSERYYLNHSTTDTLTYSFVYSFPIITDEITIELVSGCDYEVYVNHQFAIEGDSNIDSYPDGCNIDDLIKNDEENTIQILLINGNHQQDSRIAWRIEYNSYPELETLVEHYNK